MTLLERLRSTLWPRGTIQRTRGHGPGQPTCDRCPGRDSLSCCDPFFPKVQDDQVITPVMDDYAMKCCDCGLVHTFRFRAVEVLQKFDDGTFAYEHLDPTKYRVELSARRGAPGVQEGGSDGR